MKKIKHSKFKNTGILFELLTRQITLEVLNGDKKEPAKRIVQEYFAPGTELNKELRLYELLMKEKYNGEARAEKFIDTVNEAQKKIDYKKISREKYNLVSEIKDNFDMDNFLSSEISNYRALASIYKVFESKKYDNYDIKDVFDSKITLIENITKKPVKNKKKIKNELYEDYKKQDTDVRLLTYKILVEQFNKKYSNLDEGQRQLLKQYINNVNNTSKFKEYFMENVPKVAKELKKICEKVEDKVTTIKLKETISLLKEMKVGRSVNDKQVSALMMSYELVKELKERVK